MAHRFTLKQIVSGGLCCGCGACVYSVGNGILDLTMDDKGYLRPVEGKAVEPSHENRIIDVCPGIGLNHDKNLDHNVQYLPPWGPIRWLGAGHATDPEVRHQGSSGGVLSALLIHLLETNQVAFVLQTSASITEPLKNVPVLSFDRQSILSAAGSRYAPAAPLMGLAAALEHPGRFAFVGKPCDVAALRKLMALDPALRERIPFVMSFMCAGTPSLYGSLAVLEQMGVAPRSLRSFRYRGEGWPGLARAETTNGAVSTMSYNEAWGSILNRHLQSRCKMCADGTGEFADVVGADAWYGVDGYPDFSEREGRSLVIARNAIGKALIDEAVSKGAISVGEFDVNDLQSIQPYQLRRKQEQIARRLAAKTLKRPWPTYEGLHLRATAATLKPLQHLRAYLGTLKRLWKGAL